MKQVRSAAVIGSGVMGAAIAAHLANAGIRTLLLDIVPQTLTEEEAAKGLTLESPQVRSRIARAAIARLRETQPAPLYDPDFAGRITPGNLEDDLFRLSEADWIIEAVVERLDVKKEVLARVESVWTPGTMVSTNTSGISVEAMAAHLGEAFRTHFAVTHFFNPPRYMKLVEIVPTAVTNSDVTARLRTVCERQLGKGVVIGKDTPNFIANRIGTFCMLVTLEEMERRGLSVEEVDAVTGPVIGRPKTATYRMLDLIGLDTLLHVVDNVRERSGEPQEQAMFTRPPLLEEMVKRGWLGGKAGQGFYKKTKGSGGVSNISVLDPKTMEYRPSVKSATSAALEAAKTAKGTAGKIKALLAAEPNDRLAGFTWAVLKRTLLYSAAQLGTIADSIVDIDRAMRWGFSWELGPFELWDALGLEKTMRRMEAEGETVPDWIRQWVADGKSSFYKHDQLKTFYLSDGKYREMESLPEEISITNLQAAGRTVLENEGASLVDLGDDVVCLAFHSRSNAIGGDILSVIHQSAEEVSRNWRGLVIANEGRNFCVGANLMLLLMEAQNGEWDEVEEIIRLFQSSMMRLKQLERPVVAAPHRMTLGGGVEVCLPADRIIHSPETYFGLVETGVGLIPAGGGCKEAAAMADELACGGDLQPHLNAKFEAIAMAKVSTSGYDVRRVGWFRRQDAVILRQDARVAEAKRAVLAMDASGYSAPPPLEEQRIRVAGREGKAVLQLAVQSMRYGSSISEHDALIGNRLAHVLAGGDVPPGSNVSVQYLLDLECEAFLSLCGEPLTQARMQHMLATGKPLRN
ncbi:3-hydroxyacyl-CoA dehydrogenase NAD-binding domain-containing protein [Paenibacillus tarimensis]